MSRNRRIARWKIAALAMMAGALIAWLLTMPATPKEPLVGYAVKESETDLLMFVIYEKPKDFPTGYVVRKFVIRSGNPPIPSGVLGTADTLEKARSFLPPGLTNLHRAPSDEPQIVETWM